ncbi:hypothetical protein ACUC2M_02560 [Bacillus cytotoxicus]
MPKAGRDTMNTSVLAMGDGQFSAIRWTSKVRMKLEHVFFRWGFVIVLIGFLLGRAYILTNILPFALPFFCCCICNETR